MKSFRLPFRRRAVVPGQALRANRAARIANATSDARNRQRQAIIAAYERKIAEYQAKVLALKQRAAVLSARNASRFARSRSAGFSKGFF